MEGVPAGHGHSRGALLEADGALLSAQPVGNDRRPAERVEALPPLRHGPPHVADERLKYDTKAFKGSKPLLCLLGIEYRIDCNCSSFYLVRDEYIGVERDHKEYRE